MHDVLLETETGRNFAVRAAELDAVLQSADHSDRGSLPLAALHSYLEFLTHNTITGPGISAEINTVLWLTFPIPTTATPDGALAEATRPRPNRKSTELPPRLPLSSARPRIFVVSLRTCPPSPSCSCGFIPPCRAVPKRKCRITRLVRPTAVFWRDRRRIRCVEASVSRADFERPRWTRYPQVADDSGHAPEVPGGDCRQERGLHGTEREGIAPNGISPRWASRRHAVAGAPD